MSKQRLICVSCNKRGPVQSFCQNCGHPTVAASYEERIFWEMGQWESARARQGIAPRAAAASAPPAHPAAGRRPAERAPQGPDIAAVPARPTPAPSKPSPSRLRPAAAAERATPLRSVPSPAPEVSPPITRPVQRPRPQVQRPAAPAAQTTATEPAAAQAPTIAQRPRSFIPRPTRPLSQSGATMIEQVAPARLDEPVEEETVRELEDDNRVLLIRRLERTVEHDVEDVSEQDAEPVEDDLQDDLDAMVDEVVEEMPLEETEETQETVEEDRKAARAAAKQQKAAARLAEKAEKQAKREAEDERKRAEAEAKAARAAQLEEQRAAKEAAERAEEAAKAEAKAAAKRERRAGKQRPAAAVAQPKLSRRDRGFQRDIETLGLVEDETVTMSLRGRAFGPATLIVTNFRVAVVGGRRTSVRWIPFEEVNQIDTMWRGAPTVLVGGTVEVLRFRMRSEQKLSEIVRVLMTDVQASKVPGSAHHNAELTQAWCDKAGEVWDSQTGRIRLFIRRHPAFTLSWLTTLVPFAYFAAR